jgi:hypothetical protein
MSNSNEYFVFSHATKSEDDGAIHVHGFKILEVYDSYENKIDFDSRLINICKTRTDKISKSLTTITISEIKTKVFGIPLNSCLHLFPL